MTETRRALIIGCTGQDGSYLAELLLAKGYEVHGTMRRASTFNTDRIDHLYRDPHGDAAGAGGAGAPGLRLHFADLADGGTLRRVLAEVQPDEIYHLGAQSHVRVSFDLPEYTLDVGAVGTLRLLETAREVCPRARVYYAGSSEMFGASPPPQSETTPFRPRSPYGVAKVAGFHLCQLYREAYGMWIACGILFNHESPRRGETFVTRKVTRAAGRIRAGLQDKLYLGNLDARRDWGYAKDYVEAMWLMLQQDRADDFVAATGESHTVREFVEQAFLAAGLDWREHVEIDQRYFRPAEVERLEGDAAKARRVLGWEPRVRFDMLVRMMVDVDARTAEDEAALSYVNHVSEEAGARR